MNISKQFLIFALGFPVVMLSIMTGYRAYNQNVGREIVLDITGYDPRDLLSGHYLTFRVNYPVDGVCKNELGQPLASEIDNTYVCLKPKQSFSTAEISDCDLYIKGSCKYGQFIAGIERFYVPEDKASALEVLVRDKKASISVNVTSDGKAFIKDLLIDGVSWKI